MSTLTQRRLTDAALVATFLASWLTHESGIVIHSVASLVFAIAAGFHVRQNWRTYSRHWRNLRRRTSVGDNLLSGAFLAVTINGFTLWIGGPAWALGHGVVAIAATLVVFSHLWFHRRSLRRIVGLVRRRQTVRT